MVTTPIAVSYTHLDVYKRQVLGAVITGVIENIIVIFGISPYWQTAVSGVVVVAAVSLDSIQRIFYERKVKL